MYNKRYFSQAQIESDQKDIIIAQLKADIFEMKKNEEDYYQLQDGLRKLEHKYKIASEEKLISDEEFRNRHENNLKNINSFKNDCEVLSLEISSKNKDIAELNQDNHSYKQLCDQRAAEISRLKHQIEFQQGKQDQNNEEQISLKSQEELARDEKRHLLISLEDLKNNIADMHKRHTILDSERQDLEDLISKLGQRGSAQDGENQNLEAEIRRLDGDIEILEKRNKELRKNIRMKEQDIQSAENFLQKNLNEVRHYQTVTQNEIARNAELQSRISNLEGLLRNKDRHIDDLKGDIDEVSRENSKLTQDNNTLADELSHCLKHKQNLKQANEELLLTLHKYCDQDDQVREMLNRRGKLAAFNAGRDNGNNSLQQSNLLGSSHHARQPSGSKSRRSPSKYSY